MRAASYGGIDKCAQSDRVGWERYEIKTTTGKKKGNLLLVQGETRLNVQGNGLKLYSFAGIYKYLGAKTNLPIYLARFREKYTQKCYKTIFFLCAVGKNR